MRKVQSHILRSEEGLNVFRTLSGCTNETSYMEKIVAHQLVRELVDPNIQEEVLANAGSNPDLDIPTVQQIY